MKVLKSAMAISFVIAFYASNSQTFLGSTNQPLPDDDIMELGYVGETGDFSGGYQIGDYVSNFQAFTTSGEPFKLSDVLSNGKYTVVCSASITCERFTDTFDTEQASQVYQDTRAFIEEYSGLFNWVWVYVPEAHPIDGECLSNCPLAPVLAPNGDFISQHQTYQDRVDAADLWEEIVDDSEMTYDFNFDMLVDNPENRIFYNFFQRPFGIVIIDCEAKVINRGDWIHQWIGVLGGDDYLESLVTSGSCDGEPDFCDETSVDTDNDGYCDAQEIWQDWDPEDVNVPDEQNPTSILQLGQESVSVYPNPFSDQLTIEGLDENDQILIHSSLGQLVINFRATGSWHTWDLNSLPPGMYHLSLIRNTSTGLEISTQAIVRR